MRRGAASIGVSMDMKDILKVTHQDDDPHETKCFLAGMKSSLSGEWEDPSEDDDEDGSPTNWAFRCGWAVGELSKLKSVKVTEDGLA